MSIKVSVNGGTITGTQQQLPGSRRAVEIFYGVPYATADRFKRAQPCPPVEPVESLDAQRPGPSMASPMAEGPVQETPLTANVFRPTAGTGKLPVVVYIHGGGFNFGSPLERDLASFVAFAAADILVVSVMYRLGALGFSEETNLGLWDQRTAVEWVLRWVGDFGGDKGDVTLMGVSAGAHSVGAPFVLVQTNF